MAIPFANNPASTASSPEGYVHLEKWGGLEIGEISAQTATA